MTYDDLEISELEEREMDLEMLREDLVGELQAINQYQEHIDSLENEEAIRVLEHIRDDEKEHFAELTKLIQSLDEVQAEKFRKEGL
jgi:rubrerythrin